MSRRHSRNESRVAALLRKSRRLSPVERLERRSMMAADSGTVVEFSEEAWVEEMAPTPPEECGFGNEEPSVIICEWLIPEWAENDGATVIDVAPYFDDADVGAAEPLVSEACLGGEMLTGCEDVALERPLAAADDVETVAFDAASANAASTGLSSTAARFFAAYAAEQELRGAEAASSTASPGRRVVRRAI